MFSPNRSPIRSNPDLLKLLKDNQISEVYVMGLLAEGCIKATENGLINEDFKVVVIEDVLGSKNAKKLEFTLNYFRQQRIKTVLSSDLQ